MTVSSQSAGLPSLDTLCKPLVEAYGTLHRAECESLERVLEKSRALLAPLGEPLEQQIGLNRWLSRAREEAYSDWLQWLFNQMTVGELVGVLGLNDLQQLDSDTLGRRVSSVRERPVKHGHEDRAGRLDLVIEIGSNAVVAVEVKLGSADNSDWEKTKVTRGRFVKIM